MLKVNPNNHWKFFNLEHFRAVKLKIVFDHGEGIPQQSLEIIYSEAFQISETQIFFNYGESILQQSLEILYSGAFQSSKTQNVLQPW